MATARETLRARRASSFELYPMVVSRRLRIVHRIAPAPPCETRRSHASPGGPVTFDAAVGAIHKLTSRHVRASERPKSSAGKSTHSDGHASGLPRQPRRP